MTESFFFDLPTLLQRDFSPAAGVGEGWIAVNWETAEYSGVGVAAGAGSGALPLKLNINLQGHHALHFALGPQTCLRVWADGAPGYREFVTQHGGDRLQECRLGAHNWTNTQLCVALKSGADSQPAFLAYIRAEPVQAEYSNARNLVATNDGWSWVALEGIETSRDVWKFFEPFRESDFGLMLWGPAGADVTGCHRTQTGTFLPTECTHAFRPCDRTYVENINNYLQRSEPDILKVAVDAARTVGVAMHFYIRPEAFYAPFPYDRTYTSRFFLEHPQWRCRDEYGDEIFRMSYAFPEVQDHMIEYFEELLEYSPDGICLAFNRSLPMMICEEPILAECERLSGRRPRLPDEVDSDAMITARTSLMHNFLLRVCKLISTRGLELSCIVSPDEELNRVSGLDLQSLVEQGVFQSVMVHSGGFHAHSTAAWQSPFWNALKQKARVYLNGWGGSYEYSEAARFLKEGVFEPGFAGGFFWDTENLSQNPYNWEAVRRGGNQEYLDKAVNDNVAPPRLIPLTRIQGTKLGRYNPMRSY